MEGLFQARCVIHKCPSCGSALRILTCFFSLGCGICGRSVSNCDRYLSVQKYKYYIRFPNNPVFSVRRSSAQKSTNVTGVTGVYTANASRDLRRHNRGPIFELHKNIRVSVEEN